VRLAPRHREGNRRVVLSMSSMIDVTFLLLAYFLLTTIVTQREDRLSPNLAIDRSSAGTSEQDLEPQVLEVALRDGVVTWSIGTRVFTERDELRAALEELPKAPGLFVRVLEGPTVAAAAAAIQCGRDAGFREVTYVPVEE
jgi:biopolymer transport protein ExbD